ncbi:MAG TPA: YncE family protein, partial [Bryobacteraceae bacterium]|nr:YncE family protein [Bryobacteraceae bacterium]
MKVTVQTVLFFTAALVPGVLHAASTPANALLVLEKAQNSLVIVDPGNLQVVARVPAGENPHEVAVADDGLTAYISNYSGNTISRVDLTGQKPLPPVDLGALRQPHGLEFVGGKLYFTAEGSKVVGRYDPVTGKVDWVMGTGQNRTHMVIASKDLRTVLTSNISSSTISMIENQGRDWAITNVPVGRGSEGFDLTPDGKELWVANAGDHTISVIDIAQKKVIATLPSTNNANRLKITRDGKYAFVSNLGGSGLLVIDVA